MGGDEVAALVVPFVGQYSCDNMELEVHNCA